MKYNPVFLRFFCSLNIRGQSAVPAKSGCLLIALRRSALDRYVISRSVRRKVLFLSTPEAIRDALKKGAVVCVFPEEDLSWYGEAASTVRSLDFPEKTDIPVISVLITGVYDCLPPFALRPVRSRLTVVFRDCSSGKVEEAFPALEEAERLSDISLRKNRLPRDARNLEEIVYICPGCGKFFTLRGQRSGRIDCLSCGRSWTLLRGKGLLDHRTGTVMPLAYVKDMAVRALSGGLIKDQRFPLTVGKRTSGYLLLSNDHMVLALSGKEQSAFVFLYNDVESVRIEERDRLELVCRQKGEVWHFMLKPPLHACLFIHTFMRIRLSGGDAGGSGKEQE